MHTKIFDEPLRLVEPLALRLCPAGSQCLLAGQACVAMACQNCLG